VSAETVTEAEHAEAAPAAPLLRVITPGTTPEEVAAIVAVLSALGGGAPAPEAPRSEWTNPARRLRRTASSHPNPGRGAWRASALPR
jgi:hypothetical protein